MDRQFYVEYYTLEREHWWFKVRGQIIMDRIREISGKRKDLKILNVGAATGKTSQMLEEFGEVTSIEYDQICYEFVKEKLGINIHQGSITEIQFEDNSYDIVCSFDVVEHVEDDQKAVQELVRVCKKDGLVFISVPAFMSLWSHHDVVNHHFKRYVSKEIASLFGQTPSELVYKSYFNALLFTPIYLFRQLSNALPKSWTRDGAGSDATAGQSGKLAGGILFSVFNFERWLMKKGIKWPFGVSFLYAVRKK